MSSRSLLAPAVFAVATLVAMDAAALPISFGVELIKGLGYGTDARCKKDDRCPPETLLDVEFDLDLGATPSRSGVRIGRPLVLEDFLEVAFREKRVDADELDGLDVDLRLVDLTVGTNLLGSYLLDGTVGVTRATSAPGSHDIYSLAWTPLTIPLTGALLSFQVGPQLTLKDRGEHDLTLTVSLLPPPPAPLPPLIPVNDSVTGSPGGSSGGTPSADTALPIPAPAPATLALLGLGLVGMVGLRRRAG